MNFGLAELPNIAWKSFEALGRLVQQLGVQEALNKA